MSCMSGAGKAVIHFGLRTLAAAAGQYLVFIWPSLVALLEKLRTGPNPD